jgi:hypothetical protein
MDDADLAQQMIDSGFADRLHSKLRREAVELLVSAKADDLVQAQAMVRQLDKIFGEIRSVANTGLMHAG